MTPYHRVLWKAIDRILLTDWDPLLLNGIGPSDEYQSYLPSVFKLKIENATLDELTDHLVKLEAEVLSRQANESNCRTVAMKIIRL
ncbi:MAG: hypothetical protein M3R25_06115 [Bacteroidota bacterium]|nr:hypothetical protein [Bacteroidota bacterium]